MIWRKRRWGLLSHAPTTRHPIGRAKHAALCRERLVLCQRAAEPGTKTTGPAAQAAARPGLLHTEGASWCSPYCELY